MKKKNAGGQLCLCETASSCASGFGTRKESEQGDDNAMVMVMMMIFIMVFSTEIKKCQGVNQSCCCMKSFL